MNPTSVLKHSLKSSVAVALFTLALAVCALLGIDAVGREPSASVSTIETQPANADSVRRRVLVLIVDGLRYETALDSSIMPSLNQLRGDGASGKLETVFEGFSVPAIKAAFTGVAETQLINVVRNFRFSALPLESVFLDAERAGKRTLIVGDEPFRQFGEYAVRRVPPTDSDKYVQDGKRPALALDAWRNEPFDLVVCHYETTDWRAHENGIARAEYQTAFRSADSIIAAFAASRTTNDYLVVFGDHGHNARGEHKTGIYIPTFALVLGPDVAKSARFASLDIANIRLVVSHALGIRLRTSSYQASVVSTFLPIESATQSPATAAIVPDTRSRFDLPAIALLIGFSIAWFALAYISVRSANVDGSTAVPSHVPLFAVAVVAEIVLQQRWSAAASWFPVLALASGALLFRKSRGHGALAMGVALFFIARYTINAGALSLRVPSSLVALAPLYIAATVVKLWLLTRLAGAKRWPTAAALTALVTLFCVRVWDIPALSISSLVLTAVGMIYARYRHDTALLRAFVASFVYLLLYYTVRLPIYQLLWIDLFLLVAALTHARVPTFVFNAFLLIGAFTLTSLWLSTGLEWGFLYGLAPAFTLERHILWFLPLIAAKIPLLLLLVAATTSWRPDAEFMWFAFIYCGLRFIAAWTARVFGANTADVWPIAEQALYLVPFVIAAFATRSTARPTLLHAHS